MYPLKFKPILKTLVWGGEKIASFKHIDTDRHNIGESWELSGLKGDESVVANGALAGKTINGLIAEYGEKLIGKANYGKTGSEFPLLVKFIDACQDLSIHLIPGLARSITSEEYKARVADNTITDVLLDCAISPGDVFFLPAGRIHSIGAGSFIVEIQQTSDVTYRIYDFGRLGLDGKPRELHTDLAMDAIDYTVQDDYRTHYEKKKNEETALVSCKYFTASLIEADRPYAKDLSGLDSFLIIVCTGGQGEITDNEGNRESLRQGETILIPASTKSVEFIPEGSLTVLTSFV